MSAIMVQQSKHVELDPIGSYSKIESLPAQDSNPQQIALSFPLVCIENYHQYAESDQTAFIDIKHLEACPRLAGSQDQVDPDLVMNGGR